MRPKDHFLFFFLFQPEIYPGNSVLPLEASSRDPQPDHRSHQSFVHVIFTTPSKTLTNPLGHLLGLANPSKLEPWISGKVSHWIKTGEVRQGTRLPDSIGENSEVLSQETRRTLSLPTHPRESHLRSTLSIALCDWILVGKTLSLHYSHVKRLSELKRIERLVFGFFVCGELECGFHFEFEEPLAVASVLEVKLGNSCPVFELRLLGSLNKAFVVELMRSLSAGINSHQAELCFPQFCTTPCQSFTRNSGTNTVSELKRIERLVFGFFVCSELECGFHFEFEEPLAVASVLEVKLGNSCPVFELRLLGSLNKAFVVELMRCEC
ncbi:hypothetical protein Droror1_Dr00027717 [Drosera rotundifolia]